MKEKKTLTGALQVSGNLNNKDYDITPSSIRRLGFEGEGGYFVGRFETNGDIRNVEMTYDNDDGHIFVMIFFGYENCRFAGNLKTMSELKFILKACGVL